MNEINFDGIVGPTHNYSGLSYGNLASMGSSQKPSNPKMAALQGLEKMKLLLDLGIPQAVLPPHERPHIKTLKALGFEGADRNIPGKVYKAIPEMLFQLSSAAPMWVANAATITPSSDTMDSRVHITPANLTTLFHRSIEADTTSRILHAIFPDTVYFAHHPPFPQGAYFSDEGAANVTRLCNRYEGMGVHLFVYGKETLAEEAATITFPARQSLEATKGIIRSHQLYPDRVVIAKQNPEAIENGVFHNDVISVSDRNVFLYHEKAFVNTDAVVDEIARKLEAVSDIALYPVRVSHDQVPLQIAVKTYLFNSQILTLPDNTFVLIAPKECEKQERTRSFIGTLVHDPDTPIRDVHYVDLKESMQNGGGPACLRTRIVLNDTEVRAMNPKIILTEKLYNRLVEWVNTHYRDQLVPKDLADPALVDETQEALDKLTTLLNLGKIYDFQ